MDHLTTLCDGYKILMREIMEKYPNLSQDALYKKIIAMNHTLKHNQIFKSLFSTIYELTKIRMRLEAQKDQENRKNYKDKSHIEKGTPSKLLI